MHKFCAHLPLHIFFDAIGPIFCTLSEMHSVVSNSASVQAKDVLTVRKSLTKDSNLFSGTLFRNS